MEDAEWFDDLQRKNRADGEVSAKEAEAERKGFLRILFPKIVKTHDCLEIGQAVQRRGPESPRAMRLMHERAKRLAEMVRFANGGPKEAA